MPPCVVLLGPTAVGKSAIAVAVAAAAGGEIVSLDSMQVYRHLDIGTAKPTAAEQQGIPHHLLNVVDPAAPFSAADYARIARGVLHDIHARGRLPIVVGGSGLYLRALRGEIFSGPGEVAPIRARLRAEVERSGADALHARLTGLDPCVAARVHPRDTFRLIRALEIIEVTGRRVSELWEAHRKELHQPPLLLVGLRRERSMLYRRINERVDRMLAVGLMEEVERLLNAGYPPDMKPLRGHNYRHIVGVLLGRLDLHEAVRRTKQETRHYAKRQMTWFRAAQDIAWVDVSDGHVGGVIGILLEKIRGLQERHGTA
ncbi:MAG TPA: tRNA (adenosine(37)-N6)-dimethylallyltransferase MiaA [Candidatus Methylomirabilis sp.]|nr:tRNA (adenosine(37)-N6)-dimethylallyltransferase MiaA [Candidatus Methylomirabilis sp.]